MTLRKRYFAMVLCLCLLAVSLFGCVSGGGESSVAESSAISESSEVSEVSTEPQKIDGKEPYEKAVKAFKELKDFTVEYKSNVTIQATSFTTTEEIEASETVLNNGTQDMRALFEYKTVFDGEREVEERYIYGYGKLFLEYDGYSFMSNVSYSDFSEYYVFGSYREYVSGYLDSENYADIYILDESTEEESRKIYFSEPKAPEDWVDYDNDRLLECEASAVIDAEGMLSAITYYVKLDNDEFITEYSAEYKFAEIKGEKPKISLPEDEKLFEKVDYVDAIPILDKVLTNYKNLKIYETNRHSVLISEALGYFEQSDSNVQFFDYDSEFAYSSTLTKRFNIYSFEDKKYHAYANASQFKVIGDERTTLTDSGEITDKISKEDIESVKKNEDYSFEFGIPDLADIANISYDFIDGYVSLRIVATEAAADTFLKELYSVTAYDLSLVETVADEFRNNVFEYHITADYKTYMPTGIYTHFLGRYIDDKNEGKFEFDCTSAIVSQSPETYYNITEKYYPAFDQEPDDEEKAKPLLYKVTGENGEELWLFGTIHAGDNRTAYLPEEVYSAFDSADAVAFEVDIIDFTEKVKNDPELAEKYIRTYFYTDNTLFFEHIDEDLFWEAYGIGVMLGYLSDSAEYSAAYLTMKPYAFSNLITDQYLKHTQRYGSGKGVDVRLLRRAKENGKKIYNIEKFDREFNLIGSFSDELHEVLLKETVDSGREGYVEDFKKLYRIWLNGDIEAYREYMKEAQDTEGYTEEELKALEEYTEALMQDRDAQMLEKLKGYLESGETVFAAVGLTHLLNEDTGLVETLAEAGYTVELVEYK